MDAPPGSEDAADSWVRWSAPFSFLLSPFSFLLSLSSLLPNSPKEVQEESPSRRCHRRSPSPSLPVGRRSASASVLHEKCLAGSMYACHGDCGPRPTACVGAM